MGSTNTVLLYHLVMTLKRILGLIGLNQRAVIFSSAVLLAGAAAVASPQADRPPAKEVAGIPVNYDEALVGSYTLPDPLAPANGKPVRDAKRGSRSAGRRSCAFSRRTSSAAAPGIPAP